MVDYEAEIETVLRKIAHVQEIGSCDEITLRAFLRGLVSEVAQAAKEEERRLLRGSE